MTPMLIQYRGESRIRMASLPFPERCIKTAIRTMQRVFRAFRNELAWLVETGDT
jgi:hypothetical protein